MDLRFKPSLNIRQMVILGLTIMLVVISAIGLMSYHHLREIERKQHFVEVADDLSNTILEMLRYEKNHLLYGRSQDLDENWKYVKLGLEILKRISPEGLELRVAPILKRLEQELSAYSDLMQQLASLGLSLVVGAFLIPIVARKIIKPLRVIEKTTLRIADGDFRPLPVMQTHDETQRVVEAFNRMIAEIEKGQDQLLQAKKLSSLGTLTSGIAHQLNNPLNNISTSCQILLEELQQAEPKLLHRMLSNIEQEVHRARDIVRDLLEFSRNKITARAGLDHHSVLIMVEDTGKGIPENVIGRIFDPFFTTKEVGVGTGLGLSIVYGIIQKHGGSVSVESKQGEGTRFTISLPVEHVCQEESRHGWKGPVS